jgi:hypothetical protein
MPPISTISLATVLGGLHLPVNAPQSFARVNGRLVSVVGTEVSTHAPANPPHRAPSEGGTCLTLTGATFARINSIPICRDDDTASCGHVNANGETFARISSGIGGPDFGSITDAPSGFIDYGDVSTAPDTVEDWGGM